MSGKLDQSLDEILSTQRRSAGGPGRRSQRRSTGGRPAAAAPVGGVQKTSKPARAAANKPNAAKPAPGTGDSKVIVSNLPKDVNEQQIKLSDFVRHVISRPSSFPAGVVARSNLWVAIATCQPEFAKTPQDSFHDTAILKYGAESFGS
ncbi:RNA recognition domain-containing protein containing protein [Colletotrichum higginsianum IMI 349063]|uniref:RNA recognition domain-containing protein containing protein n=1 Tax=Colletotrichum higginsianum (strain IMI 349063) TaxID=759273 RepID=A0A1B7Y242_COLHI|nr:RNA recognition domain-containing protein containing protein [Colletotrichum higginsianum IMI 349063]OBR06067.1 RNA recognition domain-containing protein containing protein [Colletotrichum higginsianum IMI 349063]GJD01688.1 RNA recognition domain-containing protein containing protein [Colletotrichum higginsianum]